MTCARTRRTSGQVERNWCSLATRGRTGGWRRNNSSQAWLGNNLQNNQPKYLNKVFLNTEMQTGRNVLFKLEIIIIVVVVGFYLCKILKVDK